MMRASNSLLILALVLEFAGSARSAPPPQPAPPAKPLPLKPGDARLLDDLPKATSKTPASKAVSEKADGEKPVIGKLPPQTPNSPEEEGEDIGQESPSVRLERIGRQMASVEQRLRAGDSTRSTQALQDRIVGELDGFLKQASKPSSAKSPKKPESGNQADASGGGNLKPKDEPSEKSKSNDGSTSSGNEKTARPDLTKEVWGELPPQVREQLLNALPEKFLPAYETLIEEYYRRLAERKRK